MASMELARRHLRFLLKGSRQQTCLHIFFCPFIGWSIYPRLVGSLRRDLMESVQRSAARRDGELVANGNDRVPGGPQPNFVKRSDRCRTGPKPHLIDESVLVGRLADYIPVGRLTRRWR